MSNEDYKMFVKQCINRVLKEIDKPDWNPDNMHDCTLAQVLDAARIKKIGMRVTLDLFIPDKIIK